MEAHLRKLGRAVGLLRREGYSNDDIGDLLRDRPEVWSEVAWNYNRTTGRQRRWDSHMIADAVIEFALTYGQWPRERQMLNVNGLPSPRTLHWHGGDRHMWVVISRKADKLTPELVLSIPNLTLRREAIEVFGGAEALIKAGGAEPWQQDDYGKLWRLRLGDDRGRSAHFVEVVNSTPRPDGEFDHYFLRVPPEIHSAKDAVAWTGHFERRLPSDDPLAIRNFEGFAAQS